MLKVKDYNEALRSRVLICSIRAEEAASQVLTSLLRVVKPDSKTLGNKSSSLSFKNKIDLLFDIEDLAKEEYNQMLKFMEIRNQFIHNASCYSFSALETQYPEIGRFLSAQFPNDEQDRNLALEMSFGKLFIAILGKLIILRLEYNKGATAELDRFINAEAFRNINRAYQTAIKTYLESPFNKKPLYIPFGGIPIDIDKHLHQFESYFRHAIIGEQLTACDAIITGTFSEKDIYQRKAEFKRIHDNKSSL